MLPESEKERVELVRRLRARAIARRMELESERIAREHALTLEAAKSEINRKLMQSVDSAMRRLPLTHNKAITKQTELDRLSLHDLAQTNPVLLKVLRKVGKEGGLVI
jgi:hypothetical protein